MLQLGKFSAWINLEDVEMPQYGVEYSPDGMSASCWIASEVNKHFSVCWKDTDFSFMSSGWVSADGMSCGGKRIESKKDAKLVERRSVTTSATTGRRLVFSPFELTDDDIYLNAATAPGLGQIELAIHEIKICETKSRKKVDRLYAEAATGLVEVEKIHERSKKAIGHRIQLGEEVTIGKKPTRKSSASRKSLVSRKGTIIRTVATFVFKYRPIGLLMANGIVPIDRAAIRPASEPSEIIDLADNEEPDQDEARIMELERELLNLKERRDRNAKRVKKEVKTEVKLEQRMGRLDSEIIDLT